MDDIAHKTLEDRRLRMIIKQGTRLVIKSQATQQVERNFGPVAGLAANIYGAVSETADTRSWVTLPSAFYVTRRMLKPGQYKATFYNNGKLERMASISLKPGEMKLMRARP